MDKHLKILHIEDNASDAGLIKRELKKGGLDFVIQIVETREEFIAALREFKPDLILSDHSLPQFDSMAALAIYKELNISIPFILITGSVSEEFAIMSIKEGADDYILKNNLIRLPSAIKQAIKARQVELEKQKANLELKAANKELNTFIYKAAHDLRGPLCSIMGLANIAAMAGEEDNLPDYISKISESTHKLDAVLLSLIDVMSIKDAKPVLKEINFEELLRKILERLKSSPGYDTINFKVIAPPIPGFYSDKKMLGLILENLVENSIQYRNTLSSAPLVNITVSNDQNGIKIEVEDNGIGIEEEIHEQIFEMYFRGNQYSNGSGLGLYIVRNAVKKLGGTIDVISRIKQGSVFTVILPTDLILM